MNDAITTEIMDAEEHAIVWQVITHLSEIEELHNARICIATDLTTRIHPQGGNVCVQLFITSSNTVCQSALIRFFFFFFSNRKFNLSWPFPQARVI